MSTTVEKPDLPLPSKALPQLSHRQIVTILSGLMCGMFLAALDQTIVGTSIVKIANDLHGFDLQAWATTAYLITSTIVTPIYGKLSDIYGRKPFYLAAITIFVAGSLASSFSTSMYELASFRAVQGLGAGGLMSLAMTIIGDVVPPRERPRYQGYILAVFGLSTVLGPVLGGFFAGFDTLAGISGWRWVFLINVPIGIIALFVVAKVLNVPHERHDQKIDWWGALALVVAVVPFLIVAEQGQKWGWGDGKAILCYVVGGVGVIAFILIERLMKDAALIPLRLFKNSTFTVAIIGGVIVGVAMFGAITMIPQFMQVVQGYTPTESGLLMLPLMAGIMTSSIVSGRITSKTGHYKIFPILGTLLIAVGAFFFAQVEYNSALWHPLVAAAIIGLGLGQCMQTLVIAVQNAGPRSDMGASTASATFFRQIGGTAGVAIFLTILFNTLGPNITKAFGGKLPAGAGAGVANLSENTSGIQDLPEAIKTPVLIGFTESITTVFYVAGAVALLATVVLLFMKEIPLAGMNPAAAAVEGGEAFLDADAEADDFADAPTEIVEPVRPLDREPALVGGGKHALSNGHGDYQAVSGALPITNSISDAEIDTPVGAGGVPVIGHVRRQDGSHVAGAALTLIDQRGRQVARATGSGDGSYSVPSQGPGAYVLIVSAHGHQPQASSVVIGNGPATVDVTLTGSGELTGTVKAAATGAPLASVTVTLTDSRGEVNGAFITTTDGTYAFIGVGAGAYTLVASGPGYRPVAVTLTVPDSGVLRHDVELASSVLLAGTARTEGDRIVPDARITVLDPEGNVAAVARTDSEGRYLVSDLPAGAYTVVASGYPPATSQVELTGGEADHDVRLSYDQALDELVDRS
ncbi:MULTISPECIES: MFS transporter [unclassified Amycolatopsis]|uniref:MFS transporter n=1 Tax=unclassified Amycolatopsis TaxID=2618356 RepID=UPI002E0F0097|nr:MULTISPECIES: DHA2 family efflux MFS transporter permease subunit [unclassified Amycolatopsis]WSJ75006.1 MFS transporter [Amycolatopsis sp. NBC_01307]WSK81321.1 MFS transporter [Amycolatopsis sp. NBC_01286]